MNFEGIKNSLDGRVQIWNGGLWDPEWFEQIGSEIAGSEEMMSLHRPQFIKETHRALLAAGADAISTNTLGAIVSVMKESNARELVSKVNFESARLAREVCDEFGIKHGKKWVVGSMGPTCNLLSVLPGG